MKDSAGIFRIAQSALAALMALTGATAVHATDSYNLSTKLLKIPTLTVGAVIYSNMVVKVGSIVTPPAGGAPNGSADLYHPASGQLAIPAVTVGSATYYNVVVTVASVQSIGSVSGADTFDGTYLTVANVQLGNSNYSRVVLRVGLSNVIQLSGGMPAAGQDQYFLTLGRLYIPAVQVGSNVYTNVALQVGGSNIVSIGGGSTTPISAASDFLQNYYLAGTYSTNDAGTADLDGLEDYSMAGCAASGTPCNYNAPTITLSSGGAATGGTLSDGVDGGTFVSPSAGGIVPAFGVPTTINIDATNGAAWQGVISLNDVGEGLVAMETDASAVPGIKVGIVPLQGTVSDASLQGIYTFVGIGTNPLTGVAGDLGMVDFITFDGKGGFSATETTNTWNPNTRTGGIHETPGASSCANGATGTNLICGTYALASSGTLSLTFTTGFIAPSTFTGAAGNDLIVLSNLSGANQGPRALLAGVPQPSSAGAQQGCSNDPLLGPGLASGVFDSVAMAFNSSAIQSVTFNNGSAPFNFTQNGGTINIGGVQSSIPSGDTATYTVASNCLLIIPHQTDNLNNIFENQIGAVSPNGAVFVLSDVDTMGGGPLVSVGMRFSNVQQLN